LKDRTTKKRDFRSLGWRSEGWEAPVRRVSAPSYVYPEVDSAHLGAAHRERRLLCNNWATENPATSPKTPAPACRHPCAAADSQSATSGTTAASLGPGGIQLPASTILRILLLHHLVPEEDRHRRAQQPFERLRPKRAVAEGFQGTEVVALADCLSKPRRVVL
jgi:hypothetical protein